MWKVARSILLVSGSRMTCCVVALLVASAPAAADSVHVVALRVDGATVKTTAVRIVQAAPGQPTELQLAEGGSLEGGIEIQVPERTVVVVKSDRDNVIELAAGTRFRVETTSARGEWYTLIAGSVAVQVRDALDFFNIDFDRFVARVRGTDFTLEVDAARKATATVRAGSLSVLREVPTQLSAGTAPLPMLAAERAVVGTAERAQRIELPPVEPVRRYAAPQAALAAYQRNLDSATRSNDPDALYSALNNCGLTEIVMGRLDHARFYLERLLRLATERGDDPWRARALNNLAAIAMRNKQWTTARQALETALAINRAPGSGASARRTAQDEGNLGIVLRHLGDREGARAATLRSLELYRSLPNDQSAGIARDLENLAHLDPQNAIDLHTQARDLRLKTFGERPHPETASSYVNLGSALCGTGRIDEALKQLDQGLQMRVALRVPSADPELVGAYEALAACWARAAGEGWPGAADKAANYVRLAKIERVRGASAYRR
jgi:tetratricopeptide (TPR) repeat protein